MTHKILVLHGPNLNLLGVREPERYGTETLEEINKGLFEYAWQHQADARIRTFQSNYEGELIGAIHQAYLENYDWIVFNPAGYTHTSVSLRDALLAVSIPFVEVHITNPDEREPFRRVNLFRDIAASVVSGQGPKGYELALAWVLDRVQAKTQS